MAFDTLSLRSTHGSLTSYRSIYSQDSSRSLDNTLLYHELRLIERSEGEINVCWKGAHMMLYFMAFVFGALCTCSLHRLMYMFDEKCVLFPKVVSHASIQRIVYDFFSYKPQQKYDDVPPSTDYVSTQWADNSVCYLPTYVPLVSGLAGLVWTTMFLMCSSGTSNITGAQRHWRALPVMFIFSITMSVICIYASMITDQGLRALCEKLAEATGSPTCGYTINVATLLYEGRIRGVYQASRLCTASAWLHTACWLLSALVIAARVLLAVDFTLVQVNAQLIGTFDDMLLKHEKQINSYNPESGSPLRFDIEEDESEVELFTTTDTKKDAGNTTLDMLTKLEENSKRDPSPASSPRKSLEHRQTLLDKYIDKMLHNLLQKIAHRDQDTQTKVRLDTNAPEKETNSENNEMLAKEFIHKLHGRLSKEFDKFEQQIRSNLQGKDDGRAEDVPGEAHGERDKDLKSEGEEKKDQVNKLSVKNVFDPSTEETNEENTNKRNSKHPRFQFSSKPSSSASVKITDQRTEDIKVSIDPYKKDKDIDLKTTLTKPNVREHALRISDVDTSAASRETTDKHEEKEIGREHNIPDKKGEIHTLHITDNDDKSALVSDKRETTDKYEEKEIGREHNIPEKKGEIHTLHITDNDDKSALVSDKRESTDTYEEKEMGTEHNIPEKKGEIHTLHITDNDDKSALVSDKRETTDTYEEKEMGTELNIPEKKGEIHTLHMTDNDDKSALVSDKRESTDTYEEKEMGTEHNIPEKKGEIHTLHMTDNDDKSALVSDKRDTTDKYEEKEIGPEHNIPEKKDEMHTVHISDNDDKSPVLSDKRETTDKYEEKEIGTEHNITEKKGEIHTLHITDNDDKSALKSDKRETTDKYVEKEIGTEHSITEKKDEIHTSNITENDGKSALESDKSDKNEKKGNETKPKTTIEPENLQPTDDDELIPEHSKPDKKKEK